MWLIIDRATNKAINIITNIIANAITNLIAIIRALAKVIDSITLTFSTVSLSSDYTFNVFNLV